MARRRDAHRPASRGSARTALGDLGRLVSGQSLGRRRRARQRVDVGAGREVDVLEHRVHRLPERRSRPCRAATRAPAPRRRLVDHDGLLGPVLVADDLRAGGRRPLHRGRAERVDTAPRAASTARRSARHASSAVRVAGERVVGRSAAADGRGRRHRQACGPAAPRPAPTAPGRRPALAFHSIRANVSFFVSALWCAATSRWSRPRVHAT